MNKLPKVDNVGVSELVIMGNMPSRRTIKLVSEIGVVLIGEVFETIKYGKKVFISKGAQSVKADIEIGQCVSITAKNIYNNKPIKIFRDEISVKAAKKIVQSYTEDGENISYFNDYYEGYSIEGDRTKASILIGISR